MQPVLCVSPTRSRSPSLSVICIWYSKTVRLCDLTHICLAHTHIDWLHRRATNVSGRYISRLRLRVQPASACVCWKLKHTIASFRKRLLLNQLKLCSSWRSTRSSSSRSRWRRRGRQRLWLWLWLRLRRLLLLLLLAIEVCATCVPSYGKYSYS